MTNKICSLDIRLIVSNQLRLGGLRQWRADISLPTPGAVVCADRCRQMLALINQYGQRWGEPV